MRTTAVAVRRGNNARPSLIVLTAEFEQHDDKWVGTVLELGVSTCADTLEDVRNEIAEAVSLQLNEVERLGFMDEYLEEHGVHQIPLPDEKEDRQRDHWGMVAIGV
jgi:hypothetical protein